MQDVLGQMRQNSGKGLPESRQNLPLAKKYVVDLEIKINKSLF
jgi:hypothetical protein